MTKYYAAQQVGVADGTKVPADRADGRVIGAKLSSIFASKVVGQAWANGDQIYLGRLNPGESMREILAATDLTMSTTTLSIGTLTTPNKYVNAATLTVTNLPTVLGPTVAALEAAPLTAPEDIWLTLGVGGASGPLNLAIEMRIASIK